MTPALKSNRQKKLTQNMATFEKQLNSVTIHENFNRFIYFLSKNLDFLKIINYKLKLYCVNLLTVIEQSDRRHKIAL